MNYELDIMTLMTSAASLFFFFFFWNSGLKYISRIKVNLVYWQLLDSYDPHIVAVNDGEEERQIRITKSTNSNSLALVLNIECRETCE